MAPLREQLAGDLKIAMRAGDAVQRDELRGLMAALQSEQQAKLARELERQGLILRGEERELTAEQQAAVARVQAGASLSPDDEQAVLQQRVKQHRQSIEAFERGKRPDLVATEQAQLAVLDRYLPQQLTNEEIEQEVQNAMTQSGASGPRDQGKVMGLLSPRLRGRADMRAVSARVQALLTNEA